MDLNDCEIFSLIQIYTISRGYAEQTVITKILTGKTISLGVPKTPGAHSAEGSKMGNVALQK